LLNARHPPESPYDDIGEEQKKKKKKMMMMMVMMMMMMMNTVSHHAGVPQPRVSSMYLHVES